MPPLKYNPIPFLSAILLTLGLVRYEAAFADTCEIHLGESNLNLGQIANPGANAPTISNGLYPVGTRFISLNVSCPTHSKLLLILRGDRVAEQFRFATNGQLKVSLSNALLDGRAVDLAQIRAVGDTPRQPSSIIEVSPGDLVVPVSAGLAAEGTLLSIQIEVSPAITLDEFRTLDRKTIEGNLSIEVREY